MIHPQAVLRDINDETGYGVFATEYIPESTIVHEQDKLIHRSFFPEF